MLSAPQAVSIESAMTSRETSEYFIPSVPIEIPSLTVMVPKICGMAPAARTAASARSREHVEARVAGRDRAVAVGDPDDRLAEVGVAEADGAEHGAVGRALDAGGDRGAAEVGGHGGNVAEGERLSSDGVDGAEGACRTDPRVASLGALATASALPASPCLRRRSTGRTRTDAAAG